MNIEQLKYIVEVAKTKSITAASQNYYVSQSGISRSIASLENELGIKLFNRTRTGVEPTEEGKKLIDKAYEIVSKINEFEEQVRKLNEDSKGVLKISAVPGLFSTILLDSFQNFLKDHQNIKVEIDENTTEAIIEGINQSKINIGLIHVYQGIHKKYRKQNSIMLNK
jgi:DNA-binding transcriptional LysR family regulator